MNSGHHFLEMKIVKTSKCMGCLDMRGVQVFIVTDNRGHYLHQLRLEAGVQSNFAGYSQLSYFVQETKEM
jgi:hypothetical protein